MNAVTSKLSVSSENYYTVTLLKIDLDLIKIIQFWTFWIFLPKPPQPFAGLIYDLFYGVLGHDLLLEHIILNISTDSGWFYVKLSQQGSFLWDNQSKGSQPYVSTIITHNFKYLDQFWMVLHETFTTGLIFVRQSKQGVTTLCFEHNYTSLMWRFHVRLLKIDEDI